MAEAFPADASRQVKFSWAPVSAEEQPLWDQMVRESRSGTLFSDSHYLDSIGRRFALYFIRQGRALRGGVSLVLPDDRSCDFDDCVIYNGLILAPDGRGERLNSQATLSRRFQITEFAVAQLTRQFERVRLQLEPSLTDIRPFLWHEYGNPDDSKRFRAEVCYTSLLEISELENADAPERTQLFRNLSASRRQEIRYARRAGVAAEPSTDIERFLALYRLTMLKQPDVDRGSLEQRIARMGPLIGGLLARDSGLLVAVRDKTGQLASGAVWGIDSKRAYYLFGASDPRNAERYSGTVAVWDSLVRLARAGVGSVDFEGVNSPKRGWFKLSFGGTLTPYYQLSLGY